MNKILPGYLLPFSVSTGKNYLLLFLIWPFLAFITAIANYSRKEAKMVVYIFLIYYGLTFVLYSTGIDAYRYALNLGRTAELPFSDFYKIVGGLYTETTVDIVSPLVTFIVSRFTTNHGVLFAIWTAIFGYFYLKSISLLHDRYRLMPGWSALIVMIFFIMVIPVTTIGGVRMPVATWMFFYGAYHVVLNRDYRYLFIAMASSLVHWSFLSANAVLLIYFFAGNRNIVYIPIVILSFILPQLLAPVFESIAMEVGGPLQRRYEGYSSEGYILGMEESRAQASWFLPLSNILVFNYLILLIIVIKFIYGNLMNGKYERNLFSFLLLFISLVNFGKVIPTFGGRFQTVFYLFASLYAFLYFLKMPGNRIHFLALIGIVPIALYIAIEFRIGSGTINSWIFSPGFGSPLLISGLSLADLFFN